MKGQRSYYPLNCTVAKTALVLAVTLEAAFPWLYLKGISSGEMKSALEILVGPEAKVSFRQTRAISDR